MNQGCPLPPFLGAPVGPSSCQPPARVATVGPPGGWSPVLGGPVGPSSWCQVVWLFPDSLAPKHKQWTRNWSLGSGFNCLIYRVGTLIAKWGVRECPGPLSVQHLSVQNDLSDSQSTELVFVDILRSPRIDSQPGGPVSQPYLSYRPDIGYIGFRNRFLGIDSWAS